MLLNGLASVYGCTFRIDVRMYFGDSRIFFQFTGRYSVSSGGPSFCASARIPDISMSFSFFLNHMLWLWF